MSYPRAIRYSEAERIVVAQDHANHPLLSRYKQSRIRLCALASRVWIINLGNTPGPCSLCPQHKRTVTFTQLQTTHYAVRDLPFVCDKCLCKLIRRQVHEQASAEHKLYAK